MQDNVRSLVSRINRRKLTNNTQRALLALLTAEGEWISRSSIRVRSATSRVRDLRTDEFGGFRVECATARQLGRSARRSRQTFYRLIPTTVTVDRVAKVFEGVI